VTDDDGASGSCNQTIVVSSVADYGWKKGYVIANGTLECLVNITVEVHGPVADNTTTNATGYYEFYLPYGNYSLEINTTGYYDFYENFTLNSSVLWNNVSLIPIVDYGWKKGYVLDNKTGLPIQGAWVYISPDGNYTNETGYFEFYLAYGNYTLEVSAEGYSSFYECFTLNQSVLWNYIYLEPVNTPPPTPMLSSPVNGAAGVNVTLTLVCNAVVDADGDPVRYYFDVRNSSGVTVTYGFAGVAGDTDYVVGTDGVVVSSLLEGETYTWKVMAYDGIDYSVSWSSTWNFTTISAVPPVANFTHYQGIDVIHCNNITITIRVAGTRWNAVNMTVYADNTTAGFVSLTRYTGAPTSKNTTVHIDTSKFYSIFIDYTSANSGGSPVWITIDALGMSYATHMVFNASGGQHQNGTLNLTYILEYMIRSCGMVKFDISGSGDSDGDIVGYYWEFGDGTTGSGEVVYHSYAYGNYTVNLTVADDSNLTNKTSRIKNVVDIMGYYAGVHGQLGVHLDCPADLLITDKYLAVIDPDNSTIGWKDGVWVNNISGASGIVYGDIEIYLVPKGSEYVYRISGTDEGTYRFDVFDPGEYDPGEYDPGEYDPGEYGGKIYTINGEVTTITLDTLTITSDGDVLNITSTEDKSYSIYITNCNDTLVVTDIPINEGGTHSYTINEWDELETSVSAVTLNVDEDSNGIVDVSINLGTGMSIKDDVVLEEVSVDGRVRVVYITVFHGVSTVSITTVTPPADPLTEKWFVGSAVNIESVGRISNGYITIIYSDADISEGVNESSIRMYYWNETTNEWVLIGDSGVWTNNNTVWANIEHLTIFAPMAEKRAAGGPAEAINWLLYSGVISVVAIIIIVFSGITLKRKKEGAKKEGK